MSPVPHVPLRIAVVQFSPKIGQVQANISKARKLCSKLKPRSVDLVCFPEMIFTGYMFPNASAITPHLEAPRTGPTSQFCQELAKRLECHVTAGYPEILSPEEKKVAAESLVQSTEIEGNMIEAVGANSAVIYGPQGEWVGGYRKTNLFETDKTWAKPGTGFAMFDLPSPLRKVALGICMDLNATPPSTWTIDEGPYELADHCTANDANILILLNSWLDSGEVSEEEGGDEDWRTLRYWAARLRPLWVAGGKAEAKLGHDQEDGSDSNGTQETIVVVCNRNGEENGKTFAGSSAVFSMKKNLGRPRLLDAMDRYEEGVRVWHLDVA